MIISNLGYKLFVSKFLALHSQFPPEAITELQKIYREEFGIELSDDEAREQGKNKLILTEMAINPNATW